MFKKCVIFFCIIFLAGFISCKKSDSDTVAAQDIDPILEDIFGNGGNGGDFLPDTTTSCGNGVCDEGESVDSCPTDCSDTKPKDNNNDQDDFWFKDGSSKITGSLFEIKQKETIEAFRLKPNKHLKEQSFHFIVEAASCDELISGFDDPAIDYDEDFEDYELRGLSLGECVVRVKAVDSTDATIVYVEKELTLRVAQNPPDNDSTVTPSVVIVGDSVTVAQDIDTNGSDDYTWEVVVEKQVVSENDGIGKEPLSEGDGYSEVITEEDGEEVRTLAFDMPGTYFVTTRVTVNDMHCGEDGSETCIAETEPIQITVNQNVGVNAYIVSSPEGAEDYDPTNEIMNGVALAPKAEIEDGANDPDPDVKAGEFSATVERGNAIAFIVSGEEDQYTCKDIDIGALEDPKIKLQKMDLWLPVTENQSLACVVYLEDGDYTDEGLTFENVLIDIEGDYLKGIDPDENASTFKKIRFEIPKWDQELKLTLESLEHSNISTENLESEVEDDGTITYKIEGRFYDPFLVKLKISGGIEDYQWDASSELFELNTFSGYEEIDNFQKDIKKLENNSNDEVNPKSRKWSYKEEAATNTLTIGGLLDYDQLPRAPGIQEVVTITVSDSCDEDYNSDKCSKQKHERTVRFELTTSLGPKVEKIYLRTQTGKHKDAQTNGDFYISFCSDKIYEDCVVSGLELNDLGDSNDRNNNELNHYTYPVDDNVYKENIRYFRIEENNSGDKSADNNKAWNIQGIDVYINGDESSGDPAYINPAAHKWLINGHDAKFGPMDTAVLTITTTADESYAGTDDNVSIHFDLCDDVTNNLNDYKPWQECLQEPCLEINGAGGEALVYLDWRRYWDYGAVSYLNEHENTHDSYDDHERGDKTAYGSYFFDKDPLNREFYLKKDGDDGWIVEKAEVYIFHPASEDFLNESACNYFVNNSKQDMDSSGSGTMKITSGAFQKQPNHENCKRLHEISNKHEGSLGGLK